MKLSQHIIAFFMGYFLYCLFEIDTRGYTHWTMALTGGLAMTVLYSINSRDGMTLMKSCFLGALIITAMEFAVGVFDNIIMRWDVWDYSDMPFNIMGQICLPFSFAWALMCIPAFYLCRMIRLRFSSQNPCSFSSRTISTKNSRTS